MTMRLRVRSAPLMVGWFMVCHMLGAAAENTATLSGIVEDPSGAAVPAARLRLVSAATHKSVETRSNPEGRFEFPGVAEGEYSLSARVPGAATEIKVHAGADAAPLRIRLNIVAMEEEITVTADNPSVPEAQASQDVIEFGTDWLAGLPALGADPLAIPMMMVNPAITGALGPSVLVDGVETEALDAPLTSIRHVRVDNNPYAAEFSRPGRGRIEVITKHSIHRRYHGIFLNVFRNSALDARDPFATVRPLMQRDNSEAELEGPVSSGGAITFLVSGKFDLNNQSAVVAAHTLDGPLFRNLPNPARHENLFGRLNFRLSPTHKLSLTYRFSDRSLEGENTGGFDLASRASDIFIHKNELKLFDNSNPFSVLLNQVRVTFVRGSASTYGISDQPAVIVQDAFSSGGAQVNQHEQDTLAWFEDVATLALPNHTLRFGVGVRPRFQWVQDASNFGGTYTFATLADYAAGRPFLLSQNLGSPAVTFTQVQTYDFLQDEMHLAAHASLMVGLRHEWESTDRSHSNFAPRLALAYAPRGGRTVLRGGFGIFYDREPTLMIEQSLLRDGIHIREIDITNPLFPNPLPAATPDLFAIPSIYRVAPGLRTPYLMQTSLAVERRLGARNRLTAEFSGVRGVHLYRMRDINAPRPGTASQPNPDYLRPNPDFLNINDFESVGTSRGTSLYLTFQSRAYRNLNFMAQYIWSHTMDDTPKGYSTPPANNYDLHPEWGRADNDQRHRFMFVGTWAPFRGIRLGAVATLSSGLPYDITTGYDDNNDTVANDRAAGVHRNTGHGPGYADLDLRVSKIFRMERLQYELAADAFNLFNTVSYRTFIGDLSSPFFGRANTAYPARQMQLSMKFSF
jgi:hypothetical protein